MNPAMEFSLRGKVIVVTGAAGLIGSEVCDAYAAYGASLALTDIHAASRLEAQAGGLRAKYPEAEVIPISADLTREDSVMVLFRQVEAQWGRVEELVNLAAHDAKFDDREGEVN